MGLIHHKQTSLVFEGWFVGNRETVNNPINNFFQIFTIFFTFPLEPLNFAPIYGFV